jgi:hypothetical protein
MGNREGGRGKGEGRGKGGGGRWEDQSSYLSVRSHHYSQDLLPHIYYTAQYLGAFLKKLFTQVSRRAGMHCAGGGGRGNALWEGGR